MSMLLLVRSTDDMGEAIRAANMLLLHHQQRGAGAFADDVLGIWVRRNLDAGLPAWPGLDPEPGKGTRAEPTAIEVVLARSQAEAGVFIRESFGVSGVWRLCTLDGVLLRTAYSAMKRRQVAIEALVRPMSASRASDDADLFFIVFGSSESVDACHERLAGLRSRCSTGIGSRWFVFDEESGIIFAEEADAWCR
jgi:hypothetical protein